MKILNFVLITIVNCSSFALAANQDHNLSADAIITFRDEPTTNQHLQELSRVFDKSDTYQTLRALGFHLSSVSSVNGSGRAFIHCQVLSASERCSWRFAALRQKDIVADIGFVQLMPEVATDLSEAMQQASTSRAVKFKFSPAWLKSHRDDLLLLEQIESNAFLRQLRDLGFEPTDSLDLVGALAGQLLCRTKKACDTVLAALQREVPEIKSAGYSGLAVPAPIGSVRN